MGGVWLLYPGRQQRTVYLHSVILPPQTAPDFFNLAFAHSMVHVRIDQVFVIGPIIQDNAFLFGEAGEIFKLPQHNGVPFNVMSSSSWQSSPPRSGRNNPDPNHLPHMAKPKGQTLPGKFHSIHHES